MDFVLWNIIVLLYFSGPGIPVSMPSASIRNVAFQQQVYVGSTPGDAIIKSRLGIPGTTPIDFIRWKLMLDNASHRKFVLQISYGVGQPNTLGFKNGGHSETFNGEYTVTREEGRFGGAEIVRLKGSPFPHDLALVSIHNNLLHFLTTEDRPMTGNGGWSYTLNKDTPSASPNPLPYLRSDYRMADTVVVQTVYEGRTPCSEVATAYQIKVSSSCFKIKWKLTLNRDSKSFKPTTYDLRSVVDNVPLAATGTWTEEEGTHNDAHKLQLYPDHSGNTIYLMVPDENILLFLSPDNNLLVGNENFSYTLNRRVAIPVPAH